MQNCIRLTTNRLLLNTIFITHTHTHTYIHTHTHTHTQYFQLQVGIPWNSNIIGEIVQPCNFITGYFSEPWDSIKRTSSEEKGSNNQTRPSSCQFLKVKTAVCLETYHRFRFGVSHQTGEEILLVDLIDNMSVVSHRYRHFLHHLDKVSARSTERDRWA